MQCNVGAKESYGRLAIGVLLIFAGLYLDTWPGYLLLILGLVLVVTGIIKWCPLSKALGINTCGREPG